MKTITTLTSTILLSLLATSATAQERGGAHQREGAKPAAQHGKKTDAQRGHSDKPATRDKVQEQGRGTGHDAQGKGHDKARDAHGKGHEAQGHGDAKRGEHAREGAGEHGRERAAEAKNKTIKALAHEMTKHRKHVAQIERLTQIAKKHENAERLAELDKLVAQEKARHERAMSQLKEKVGAENVDKAMAALKDMEAKKARGHGKGHDKDKGHGDGHDGHDAHDGDKDGHGAGHDEKRGEHTRGSDEPVRRGNAEQGRGGGNR